MSLTLRQLRLRAGLTQGQLADLAGLRQATLSEMEAGKSRPRRATIQAIADVLNAKVDEVEAALHETRSPSDAPSENDAIGQLSQDWPFLSGLDSDLRTGLATSLVAEWTHSSTALEGNTITLGDTLFVLTEGLTISGKSLSEHQEIHGHGQALALMVSWIRGKRPIGISQLHQLHRAIQTGSTVDGLAPVGAFKLEPNGTTAIKTSGESQWHDYAHPRNVPNLIKAFLELLKRSQKKRTLQQEELVRDYTTIHLAFTAIHPYADGNGRMARLLSNIPLLRAGFPPILIDSSQRRNYLTLLGDYSISRGQAQPSEDLVFDNKEGKALEQFFSSSWEGTLNLVEDFQERQKSRE